MSLRIRKRYGKLEVVEAAPEAGLSWSPERIIDDVIGVLGRGDEEPDRYRRAYLLVSYGSPNGEPAPYQLVTEEQWEDLALRLNGAVHVAAETGSLAVGLIGHWLEGIHWLPDEQIEVDHFPAFVGVSLLDVIQRGGVNVRPCENCGIPWVGEGTYCNRPAPGHHTSCRKLMAGQRFAARRPDFLRERKKLYERVRRGTLPRAQYDAWKATNHPGEQGVSWRPYSEWSQEKENGDG